MEPTRRRRRLGSSRRRAPWSTSRSRRRRSQTRRLDCGSCAQSLYPRLTILLWSGRGVRQSSCAPSWSTWLAVCWLFLQLQPCLIVSSPQRATRRLRSAASSRAITWKPWFTYPRCGSKLASGRLASTSRRISCSGVVSLNLSSVSSIHPSLLLGPLPLSLRSHTLPLPPSLALTASIPPHTPSHGL
jgi:hypothetical protein